MRLQQSLRQRLRRHRVLVDSYRRARHLLSLRARIPPFNWMLFLRLRRLTPLGPDFGQGRGQPVDRYYIDQFLARHADDVRGRVLEVQNNRYTVRAGGVRVERSDVLDLWEGNRNATIIADLATPGSLPAMSWDCAIITQTLQLVFDVRAAVQSLHHALRPGGVLLVTVPGISKIAYPSAKEGVDRYHDCWRFTAFSAARVFGEFFPAENLEVRSCGNVFTSIAFLHGLTTEELEPKAFAFNDPEYQMLITVRAVKP